MSKPRVAKSTTTKTVSEKIEKINVKSEKKIKKVLLNANADKIPAKKDEWKSTPNLAALIETNGRGQFRSPITLDPITLSARKGKAANKARTKVLVDQFGNKVTVSLQKFVALVYHPSINGSIATKVLDGDRDNLTKDNVAWSRDGNWKY